MGWNFTADTYKTAERDFRCAFEAYTGIEDALDRTMKMRSEDEAVECIAKQLAFALHLGHGQRCLDGFTSKDLAMWELASRLKIAVLDRMMLYPQHVQDRIGELVHELPPPLAIGPMRVDKRQEEKERRRAAAAAAHKKDERPRDDRPLDYYVPPSAEEQEAERRRKELARRTREQTVYTEKPYSEPGPSHRSTLKEKPQSTPSELLERKQWQEGRATRKEEAEEKIQDAQRAAKERARKKAQKQRKKAALLAKTDDHVLSKPQEIKLADYVK